MQLGSYPVVDPRGIQAFYSRKGYLTDIIKKCNHQEYRYIDGYGKGYFLLTHNISSETVSFTSGSRTVSLRIIDKLWLEHPSKSDTGLWVYVTAEPKYYLQEAIVDNNYNITIDKSISLSGPVTIAVMEAGGTALTMSQVLADILPVGYTLSFHPTDITSYDIAINGMSVLEAFDHLCTIYGWVWTVLGSTVHVWKMDTNPTVADPIVDIQASVLNPQVIDYGVAFPYYDYPGYRTGTKEYYSIVSNDTGQGIAITVCDPYLPAFTEIYAPATPDSIRNISSLSTRAALIAGNLDAINESLRFVQKDGFEAPSIGPSAPISLSEVYGDWGDGPKSIYKSIPFPYVKPKIPVSKARWANNWRGILAIGYNEVVPYFVVEPVYGFDGKIPVGLQRVENIYGWNYGETGWKIRVEWNPQLGQWEALQQEYSCPPDPITPIPYDPPDYEPPYTPPE